MKTKISTLLIMLLPFICFSQILWENFEDTRIGYYEFVHGGMTPRLDNPLPNAINNSELCAQYVRNPGETYDVIVLIANGPFFELTDYISGAKKMKVDVFSPAAGIPLQITLEDSAVAGATNYPDGRHSIYTATTTVANEWETVEFTFDSRPDNTVPDEDVTSLILLFDIGNNTGDTYYFDNLYVSVMRHMQETEKLEPYFQSLPNQVMNKIKREEKVKAVSIKSYFKYSIAAAILISAGTMMWSSLLGELTISTYSMVEGSEDYNYVVQELSVEDIFDLEFIDDETLDEIFTSEEGQYFIDESSEDLLFDVDDELLEEFF